MTDYADGGLVPGGREITLPIEECVIPVQRIKDGTWTCGRLDIAHLNARHGGWMVVEDGDTVQVTPCGDTIPHGGEHCECQPMVEHHDRTLVVHQSADRREKAEW